MMPLAARVAARWTADARPEETSAASRVAARYKDKKVTDEGNTVYLYSERQVARRNNEKAQRLESLRKGVHKLRAQVKKDLQSGEPEKVLTALAVGLMDHTAERVGNPSSAEEGHFGVTGWNKSHVSFSKGKATVKYVGKSGVKQSKTVSDKALVKALRDAYEACEDGIFCHETVTVDAKKVNAYLKKFDITAKDLRGLHANTVMQEKLKALRKGELPTDPKERKEQLKKEFKKALEETAADVGHEPSTLRSQYLVPNLEDEYMKGRVMDKMVKTARRVACYYWARQTPSPPTTPLALPDASYLVKK
jgi:DNA topoisomerase-1